MSDDKTLFLYTSNIRERYIDDALAVVAQQSRTRVRFRYAARYFDPALAELWGTDGDNVVGRRALIHYSIQHAQRFHPAAFVPLRHATVAAVQTHGDIRVIDLELGGYCSLPGVMPERGREDLGEHIRQYSEFIRENHICNPDAGFSAGVGPDFKSFTTKMTHAISRAFVETADEAFQAIVQYLAASLTNPGRFYYRVVNMHKAGPSADEVEIANGEYRLTTGESYRLTVVQQQDGPAMLPAELDLAAGEGVDLHDVDKLELRSIYDVYQLSVDVNDKPSIARSYLEIKPSTDRGAAEIRLPLLLQPSVSQTYAIPGAAAVATGIVALGSADALPANPGGAWIAVGASLLLFWLAVWQARRQLKLWG